MHRFFVALCLLTVSVASVRVAAQTNPYKDGTPGVTGYRSEVLSEVIVQGEKFVRLAEAIPADKYTWRPAPGARCAIVRRSFPARHRSELQPLHHGRIEDSRRYRDEGHWQVDYGQDENCGDAEGFFRARAGRDQSHA